ncbi:MAG: SDR family NAD(P)-dependent oxidoreductase, partial [Hyphomicrobiales bacterium]|nr:SDR family NAD(P)-dependent oxidoreductase [Hyphomicrobiales bacterium]
NFFGWHDLTCRLIPAMRKNGAGRIIQCSSILGLIALPYRGAYIASKYALEGLSNTLRLELRGSGISVSTIEPGPIATKFVETAMAHFHRNIDAEASAHREIYRQRIARMERGGDTFFKLPADAVIRPLRHALTSRRPKPHYYVTVPTHALAALRRVLPSRTLYALLAAIAKAET